MLFIPPTSFSPLLTRMYCFTKKLRDLSILIPLRQSVCRAVSHTSQSLHDKIKQHVPKSIRSCSCSQKRILPAVYAKLPLSLISSLLLFIQPFVFIFYKILSCDDNRLFFSQGHSPLHLSILEAIFIKTSDLALRQKKRTRV